MNKAFILRALYATAGSILFTALSALAQPGSGGPGPGTQPPDPSTVPIDGGASLLLAAGGAYGLKRLRAMRAAKAKA
jgi:hypothetical protein